MNWTGINILITTRKELIWKYKEQIKEKKNFLKYGTYTSLYPEVSQIILEHDLQAKV